MGKKYIYGAAFAAATLLTGASQADFVLQEDFESFETGDFLSGTNGTLAAAAGWSALNGVNSPGDTVDIIDMNPPVTGSTAFSPPNKALNSSNVGTFNALGMVLDGNGIADGDTGTLFFQYATRGDNFVVFRGGFDDGTGDGFPISGNLQQLNTGALRVRDNTADVLTGVSNVGNAIMNVWFVIDNANDTYDLFVQSDEAAAFVAPVQLGDDLDFDSGQYVDGSDISRFTFLWETNNGVFIDNIFLDADSVNLNNPTIPEPGSLGIAGFGALLMLARRRRKA
ncbi:MAG: PEP-CTERM sorting domain-containing protein [Planctomycetota bacterium]